MLMKGMTFLCSPCVAKLASLLAHISQSELDTLNKGKTKQKQDAFLWLQQMLAVVEIF